MASESSTDFVPTAERPTREGPTPLVTLVFIVSQPGDGFEEALTLAAGRAEAGGVDVVAVHRGNLEARSWSERHPGVRWIAVATEATDDELRERGISEADGDIVRFLDDRFPARWAADDASPSTGVVS